MIRMPVATDIDIVDRHATIAHVCIHVHCVVLHFVLQIYITYGNVSQLRDDTEPP